MPPWPLIEKFEKERASASAVVGEGDGDATTVTVLVPDEFVLALVAAPKVPDEAPHADRSAAIPI